eukprot:3810063-Rhodomonas_salina.1
MTANVLICQWDCMRTQTGRRQRPTTLRRPLAGTRVCATTSPRPTCANIGQDRGGRGVPQRPASMAYIPSPDDIDDGKWQLSLSIRWQRLTFERGVGRFKVDMIDMIGCAARALAARKQNTAGFAWTA